MATMTENKEFSSLSELESDKSKWNLESDLKLLNTLKCTTDDITKKIQNNSTVFDNLNYKSRVCTDKINNLITDVLILTNSKFIENRVYEEDIKEIAPVKSSTFNKDDQFNSEQEIIKRLKNSISYGITCFAQKYNLSENDLENLDKTNLLGSLYVYRNQFTSRPLPYLIGSDDFTKDTFVGLKAETDNPVIVLNNANYSDGKDDQFEPSKDVQIEQSDNSSGSFNFATQNSLNEKPSENLNSSAEGTEVLFIPKNDIFSSNLDEDDIFSEPVTSNHKPTSHISTVSNTKPESNLNNQSIVNEIKKASIFKKNVDFFNSDEESEDDLFEKKRPVKPQSQGSKTTNTVAKSSLAPVSSEPRSSPLEAKLNEQKSTPPKAVQTALDSIFSSDDDDIDIFNVTISKSKTNPIKEDKISTFSSSDDDEDDLFSQKKSENKISIPNMVKPATESKKSLVESLAPKEQSSSASLSSKALFLPNVINELNAALRNKKVENEAMQSSDDESEAMSSKVNFASSNLPATPVPQVNVSNDSLSDILKHKAKLNSKRNRKMPSRFSRSISGSPRSNMEKEVNADCEKVQNNVDQVQEREPKIEAIFPLNKQVEPSQKLTFSSSDESEHDLFGTKENKSTTKTDIQSVSSTDLGGNHRKTSLTSNMNKMSLFDSSDDSDSDIFKKAPVKPNLPKVSTGKEPKKIVAPISLFSDSDDEDDFLTSGVLEKAKEKTANLEKQKETNESAVKKAFNVKKSIFDEDSDDDLFK